MFQVQETCKWNSRWCIGHISPCPNHSRWLQMDTRRSCRGKALLIWQEHPYCHCSDKNLFASFVESVLNLYSNSYVGFLSWRSHLCISLEPLLVTTDSSEVMFTSLFSGNWKFETPGSACQESKEFFLLYVLTAETLSSFEESWFHLLLFFSDHYLSFLWSNLWYYSPYIYIPNNGHLFTWLEMIQNEWDDDISSIAIKCGNNCGWKRMSSSCSIKGLTVIEWRWIRLFCTGRLNTRQEVWLLPGSQLS